MIGFDLQLLADAAITGINIFILFFGLSYLLFNPVRDLLNKRREKIAGELKEAAEKEASAKLLKSEYETKLRQVDKEADEILEMARKKAKAKENEIIEEAKQEAARIIERANKEIDLEKKKVVDDMKNEMVNIASLMASKAIENAMDIQIQSGLIEETLKEMGENTWQS